MTQAGLYSIETAKENGSWSYLDDVEALVIPKDLKEEADNWRHHLIEETAAYDEKLLDKYAANEEIKVSLV